MNDLFTLGETLRMAREHLKMSQRDVAEATRMKVHIVDAIEHNDFTRISVPLYGKGFIKLYAECVGLDPDPLVQEYLNRYARKVRPSLQSDYRQADPVAQEPLPAMPSAQLARKRPPVDWSGMVDDVAHAFREQVSRWTVAWARLRSSSRSAGGPGRARRYRTSTFMSLPAGVVRIVAYAAGAIALVALLIYGGVRLAHRQRTAPVVAVTPPVPPPRVVVPPAPVTAAVKGPLPLRLAEEPPAPYLKPRLP